MFALCYGRSPCLFTLKKWFLVVFLQKISSILCIWFIPFFFCPPIFQNSHCSCVFGRIHNDYVLSIILWFWTMLIFPLWSSESVNALVFSMHFPIFISSHLIRDFILFWYFILIIWKINIIHFKIWTKIFIFHGFSRCFPETFIFHLFCNWILIP